ncbi:hypothetical protein [Bergeriella denitrificans]|uniref:Putative phage fiber-spike protein n=1 Tax=Bergeriella denitrificans TaxID=494 RepID=A0A378UFT6_BERDE|nr:hypothetical protein [Bergeriella denitrificans]STZ75579.1 putative phage fiber-spike protein [Bergeriella denitrificans]
MTQIQWTKPVCQLDADGLYLGPAEADLDVHARDGSYLVPGGCIDTAPPEPRDGHAARWTGEAWEYIPDHRGKTAYNINDGSAVQIESVGELPAELTLDPRPSEAHEWRKGRWTLNQAKAAELAAAELEQAKRDKLLALNQSAQDYINAVAGIDLLPDFEVRTWTLQALEAKAWAADPNAPTPTLDTISAARSIPADILKQKALEKALAFEQLTATVVGFRQAIESQIKQAEDMDQLAAIEFAFGGR